jgi:hypothetical protein
MLSLDFDTIILTAKKWVGLVPFLKVSGLQPYSPIGSTAYVSAVEFCTCLKLIDHCFTAYVHAKNISI